MHTGRLDTLSAAARVYRYFRMHPDAWLDSWRLTLDCQTTAISTRVAEIRAQLPSDELIETKQEGKRFYYRWRRVEQPTGVMFGLGI
jgi:hypothetical protein